MLVVLILHVVGGLQLLCVFRLCLLALLRLQVHVHSLFFNLERDKFHISLSGCIHFPFLLLRLSLTIKPKVCIKMMRNSTRTNYTAEIKYFYDGLTFFIYHFTFVPIKDTVFVIVVKFLYEY